MVEIAQLIFFGVIVLFPIGAYRIWHSENRERRHLYLFIALTLSLIQGTADSVIELPSWLHTALLLGAFVVLLIALYVWSSENRQ